MATDEQASNFLFCVLLASFSHARQKQFLLKGVRTAFDSNLFVKIYIYTALFITYMGKASFTRQNLTPIRLDFRRVVELCWDPILRSFLF